MRKINASAVNANIGYKTEMTSSFSIISYFGSGFYCRFGETRVKLKQYVFDSRYKYSERFIPMNMGIQMEFDITSDILFTVGCKYMIDFYDGTDYIPLNVGIGRKF
jgi:hypothetical protein